MVLVVGFYVRLYVHFLGLYVYLKIVGVKNIRFGEPVEPFQILTKYNQNMPVHLELGAAVAGQCFNIVLFVCFMVVNYFWRKIFGRLPDMMSKWMMGYGVGVVLDGVLVFVSACFVVFVLLCIMRGVVVLCTVPLYTNFHCEERMNVQYWV
jgi:tellurite resistance protein TehA-like permease